MMTYMEFLEINDMKLVTAAMRILGLRCKSQAKIRETISKEDLDAHRRYFGF